MVPSLVAAIPLLATLLVGGVAATTCNVTTPCPASFPCCSEFGFCGTDSFCLGGCNPLASNTLTSCKPEPRCKDATYTFTDNSRILNSTFFDGNTTAYDWVLDKGNIFNTNSSGGELALTLTETNGGTRLSSTNYVHYGTITARLKTGKWAGVVTAFITMSDIRDEVDWEFPGANTTEGQTNYFWQGFIPTDKNDGKVQQVSTDTYANYHDYTIDWQPKTLTFAIDGNVVRTINQADAVDASGVNRYPSTPSRVQLSLWPAGIESSSPGTVTWAGGMINWQDPDYLKAGHFFALVKQVTVKCADPKAAALNDTAYQYGANTTSQTPSIFFTNQTTLLNTAPVQFGGESMRLHSVIAVTAGLLLSYFI